MNLIWDVGDTSARLYLAQFIEDLRSGFGDGGALIVAVVVKAHFGVVLGSATISCRL